ncbi:MAG TPA: hypothetical protein VNZ44_06190 [Pyrinomonadaceae bacterium]|nr:hypothetical protein [Pyrinomonadaceae bacterium]
MSFELDKSFGHGALVEGGDRGSVELEATYAPDEAESARVLLMILGLPEDEIERVVAEMALDSQGEM